MDLKKEVIQDSLFSRTKATSSQKSVLFTKYNIFERNGNFHVSENGCALVLQKDLEYWIIDELIMEACCALKYFPQIEVIVIVNHHRFYSANMVVTTDHTINIVCD